MIQLKPVSSPRMGCSDRWVEGSRRCHTTCPKFIEYEESKRAYKAGIEHNKKVLGIPADQYLMDHCTMVTEKMRKMKRYRRRSASDEG